MAIIHTYIFTLRQTTAYELRLSLVETEMRISTRTQTHRHTDTQTHRQTQTQTHTHTHKNSNKHPPKRRVKITEYVVSPTKKQDVTTAW